MPFEPGRLHCRRGKDRSCERVAPAVRKEEPSLEASGVATAEGKLCGCREIQVSGAGLAIALECGSFFLLSSIASLLERYHKTSFWS